MYEAMDELRRLIEAKAKHRNGWRIDGVSLRYQLFGLQLEVDELKAADEGDMLEELADVIIVTLHIALNLGLTGEELEAKMKEKLALRFDVSDE